MLRFGHLINKVTKTTSRTTALNRYVSIEIKNIYTGT
jgi:hypothetical protein